MRQHHTDDSTDRIHDPGNDDGSSMKTQDVLEALSTDGEPFRQSNLADLLGIRQQNVSKWKGRVPPSRRAQLVIEAGGRLKVGISQIEQWEREREMLLRAIQLGRVRRPRSRSVG